jgi:uncharacterized glyoxalase superfamily protein PhnB
MPQPPVVVALPIADRPRAFAFYRDGLGLEPIGEPAGDGVPEPLQFALGDGVNLMLIPTGGFDWITGDQEVAARGTSECAFSLHAADDAEVDAIVRRALDAGAAVLTEPGEKPWGYVGAFTDPDGHVWMVTH